jgi:NADPH:quinone reductase-like Zn-dependent oxidoreductase
MKGIGQNKYGDVDTFEEVTLEIPKLNNNDILVKLKATAVNPVDAKKRTNWGTNTGEISNKPLILGYDGSGIIKLIIIIIIIN